MPPFEFCIPTVGTKFPSGPEWLHEIKYDGYRLRLERDGDRVRLITRGGYNWTDALAQACRKVVATDDAYGSPARRKPSAYFSTNSCRRYGPRYLPMRETLNAGSTSSKRQAN